MNSWTFSSLWWRWKYLNGQHKTQCLKTCTPHVKMYTQWFYSSELDMMMAKRGGLRLILVIPSGKLIESRNNVHGGLFTGNCSFQLAYSHFADKLNFEWSKELFKMTKFLSFSFSFSSIEKYEHFPSERWGLKGKVLMDFFAVTNGTFKAL